MHLYNVTIQPPTSINHAIVGNFVGNKQQDIIVSRVTRLELLRPDPSTYKLQTILSHDTFGIIRSLVAFRLTGSHKDRIIVGSDSGRIVILEYDPDANVFKRVHQETYGKTGVRRVVPGEYLAIDPKGRALMIGAIEKQKLVYVLNRDAANNLTISSPLEAHKNHGILTSIVGLDNGFDNPIFAAVELDYTEADLDVTGRAAETTEKNLVYYELDLGLNHVVRKWTEVIDRSANLLLNIPGGTDGPSGVLVCSEGYITYKHHGSTTLRLPLPRRDIPLKDSSRSVIIVSAVLHRMKGTFFYLLQTEEGDLLKLTMEFENDEATTLNIKYFDTVPVATSLCILKNGCLFVAAEFGNHHFYQFEKLGDDDDEREFTSAAKIEHPVFSPRPLLNLALIDELDSMNPLMDAKVMNLNDDDTPQIFTLCGRGARSSLRSLQHGLEVTEIVASELPGVPKAVWTTKQQRDDEYDSYIVLSFVNGTLVLSIGETVEEVTDSGFLSSAATLAVQQIGADALLQVHPKGIRHIQADKRVNEWKTAADETIVRATTNNRQVVIALDTGELVYFEMDNEGQLNEFQDRRPMGANVTCLSVGEVPAGRQRSLFLSVGCDDNTVRMISLDLDNTLEQLSIQALTAPPESLCTVAMQDLATDRAHTTNYLYIGLQNGVMLRTIVDAVNGALSDTRTRFLGSRAVKLFRVPAQGATAVLALSSRPWLSYSYQGNIHLTPMSYDALDYGWSFSSEQCPEGIVGIYGNNLRIFNADKLGQKFKSDVVALQQTPRKFMVHPETRHFYVLETDNRTYSPKQRGDLDERLPPEQLGTPKAPAGMWYSTLQVMTPQGELLNTLEFGNEAAFCFAFVSFANRHHETFLVVGTGEHVVLSPPSCTAGYIHVYSINGTELTLVHKTQVEHPPSALIGFQGRLVAAVGRPLRIYDMGMKKLLRKCETKAIPNKVVQLHTQGSRIVAADVQDSLHYLTYKAPENKLLVFADDTSSRYVTASTMVDYETVVGGDKFGNVFVNRVDAAVSESVDDDPTGHSIMHDRPVLMGAPNKTELLCIFHIGDIITSIQKTVLVAGGREVLLYTTLLGSIGVLVPFVSKDDVEFFQNLELAMRIHDPPIAGRDHLQYRGYYQTAKAVYDGDLCERYGKLPIERQNEIAEDLDRSVQEVLKKIEDMRVRSAF